MSYFNGTSTDLGSQAGAELEKAMSAGYGTDSAAFVDGRALIKEDVESTLVNVTAELKEDAKVFNSLKKEMAGSTVHEYNKKLNQGDYKHLSVAEGAATRETSSNYKREVLPMKYIQTMRSVTLQMESVKGFANAYAEQKIDAIESLVKAAEHQIFQGNSAVIPTEFDGLPTLIKADKGSYVKDARGASIASLGESLFDDAAQEVFTRGGDLTRALYPSVLAKDIKALFSDKFRYIPQQTTNLSFKAIPDYAPAIGGNIQLSGSNAGADKYFRVKGIVQAEGDPTHRPNAPTSVTATQVEGAAGSKFSGTNAGTYQYTVHAVNAAGISAGTAVAAGAVVAAKDGVKLTITPSTSGEPATGFIICRSAKDGTQVMEMCQIANSGNETTEFVDLNTDLPGTASLILLSDGRVQPILKWAQLMPAQTFPLFPTNSAVKPFLTLLYGALELNAPKFCAMYDNLAYNGGLY